MCLCGIVFVYGFFGFINVFFVLYFFFLVMECIVDRLGFGGILFVEFCMIFDIDFEE